MSTALARRPRQLRLGRVLGVAVYVSPGWAVLSVGFTVAFAGVFDDAVTDVSRGAAFGLAAAFALLCSMSVLIHEIAHCVVANALGLQARRIVLFLLGGASDIDPEPARPRDEFLVAIAGPLASAGVGALTWLWLEHATSGTALAVLLELLVWTNVVVAVFNGLPGLPLDGGRAVRAIAGALGLSRVTATRVSAVCGQVVAVAAAASGLLVGRGAWTVLAVAMTAALGAYLWAGAVDAVTAARVDERVPGLRVAALLRPTQFVPATLPLAEALRQAEEAGARAMVVLGADGVAAGYLDAERLAEIPRPQWPWTPVGDAAVAIRPETTLADSLAGAQLLSACIEHPAAQYLVVDGAAEPLGMITASDIRAALYGPASSTKRTDPAAKGPASAP